MAGLLYLQHAFDASGEAVVNTWVENPYWQFFTCETYLRTEVPIYPSSLTRWKKRIGEEGVETRLALSIEAARKAGMIWKTCVDRVIVDTTVMPKAITYPIQPEADCSSAHASTWSRQHGRQERHVPLRARARCRQHEPRH